MKLNSDETVLNSTKPKFSRVALIATLSGAAGLLLCCAILVAGCTCCCVRRRKNTYRKKMTKINDIVIPNAGAGTDESEDIFIFNEPKVGIDNNGNMK